MSHHRKPSGPGVSPDPERRDTPAGRSWTSLEEQRCGGSEPGVFHHVDTAETPGEDSAVLAPVLEERGGAVLRDEIRAVSVNGTLIVPEPCCLVTPVLRRPPDPGSSPALAVPLLCCGFDPALDCSATLISSFSRFPYPTQAELSRLTAASWLPEGQIRAWFSTQRLKQGISWAPEEVEEARKKMFNGSAPASNEGPAQSNAADVSSIAGADGAVPAGPRRGAGAPVLGSGLKWATSGGPAAAAEQKVALPRPPEPPKERLPLSPLASTNLTASLTHPQMNNHASTPFIAPKNKLSCFANGVALFPAVTRAAVDQSLPHPAPLLQPADPLRRCGAQSDGRRWPSDQAEISQCESENSCAEFPLRGHWIPAAFPLLERAKDRTPAQTELLEESFTRSGVPSGAELQQLAVRSGLSGADLESRFLERRALWDPCSGPC